MPQQLDNIDQDAMETESKRETGLRKSVSLFSCAISVLALLLFVVSHAWRPDALMLATVFPVFVWLVSGLLVSATIVSFSRWRIGLLVTWLLAAFVLGDSPISMLRQFVPVDPEWQAAHDDRFPVRVVSINCSSSIRSLEECMELDPDVVLLQESPGKRQMEELAADKYPGYSVVWSGDASMFIRGTAIPTPVPANINGQYVFAEVTLKSGARFNVASTRLIPSVLRFDFWTADSWNDFADNRRARRKQLQTIYDQINAATGTAPTIFGGDFNAPARDAVFEILTPTFRDAFVDAGRGWGKTIVNDYPAQRIDQVWITPQFDAVSVTARKTLNTDHRMVVCDLWLNGGAAELNPAAESTDVK